MNGRPHPHGNALSPHTSSGRLLRAQAASTQWRMTEEGLDCLSRQAGCTTEPCHLPRVSSFSTQDVPMGTGGSVTGAKGRPGVDLSGQGWEVKSLLSPWSAIHRSWQAPEGTAERASDQDEGAGQMRRSLRPGRRTQWLAPSRWPIQPGCLDSHREGPPGTLPAAGSCRVTGHLTQRCPQVPPALPGIPAHLCTSSSLPGPGPAPVSAAPDLPTGLLTSVPP